MVEGPLYEKFIGTTGRYLIAGLSFTPPGLVVR